MELCKKPEKNSGLQRNLKENHNWKINMISSTTILQIKPCNEVCSYCSFEYIVVSCQFLFFDLSVVFRKSCKKFRRRVARRYSCTYCQLTWSSYTLCLGLRYTTPWIILSIPNSKCRSWFLSFKLSSNVRLAIQLFIIHASNFLVLLVCWVSWLCSFR